MGIFLSEEDTKDLTGYSVCVCVSGGVLRDCGLLSRVKEPSILLGSLPTQFLPGPATASGLGFEWGRKTGGFSI